MKYLFLMAVGCLLFSFLGSCFGFCTNLDFDKWANWIFLLPLSLGIFFGFIGFCILVIKKL
jgi:hypothetical protein